METTSPKTVYFIRHGQTEANIFKIVQGPDSALSENGVKQAKIIAKRAKKLNFEHIVSSDYERTKVTAEHIQKVTQKPMELSELFREYRRPSEFWGKPVGEPGSDDIVVQGYTQIEEHFGEADWHYSDEENFFDLKDRALRALKYIEQHECNRLLIVTHGNFLRIILGVMLRGEQYSPDDYRDIDSTFRSFNTAISVAEYLPHWRYANQKTWMINTWNDQVHLGEL